MRTLTVEELELIAGGVVTLGGVVVVGGGGGDGGGDGGWGGWGGWGGGGGDGGGGNDNGGGGGGGGGDASPAHGDAPPVNSHMTFHASDKPGEPGVNHGDWTVQDSGWTFKGSLDITDGGHINKIGAEVDLSTSSGNWHFSTSSPGNSFTPDSSGGYRWDLGNGLVIDLSAGFNSGNDEVSANLNIHYTF